MPPLDTITYFGFGDPVKKPNELECLNFVKGTLKDCSPNSFVSLGINQGPTSGVKVTNYFCVS